MFDALRPFADFVSGPPVKFVISDLRVSGNAAFVSATAQRPGGGQFDPAGMLAYERGAHDLQAGDLDRYHAFFKKVNGAWIVWH